MHMEEILNRIREQIEEYNELADAPKEEQDREYLKGVVSGLTKAYTTIIKVLR